MSEPVRQNPYLPIPVKLEEVTEEVSGPRAIKNFKVRKVFDYKPGQCAMLTAFGFGEAIFAISSSPLREIMEFGVLKTGVVTEALQKLRQGDHIGIRGPYGNSFPVDEWEGKNLIFVGGGIGITPLRACYSYVLDNREKYNDIHLIYGARSSLELAYKKELFELEGRGDIKVQLSIDRPEDGWTRFVGFVPDSLLDVSPLPENSIALTCGPPIMIKFVVQNLQKLGFKPDQIYTTLERRMKCGIGKCGRCNLGELYVCKDGPVFSLAQLNELPEEG
jgi:NAD(P)H-flavin reductase